MKFRSFGSASLIRDRARPRSWTRPVTHTWRDTRKGRSKRWIRDGSSGIGSGARFTTWPACSRVMSITRSRFIAPYDSFTTSASGSGRRRPSRVELPSAGDVAVKIAYLCPDLGIPVLGRKGASAHVRGLVGAFRRAGHSVVLVAATLNGSPWEESATVDAQLLHVPLGEDAENAGLALKALNVTLGLQTSLPGELRRILYNQVLAKQLMRQFENSPPDLIYERASLYATAGVTVARELNVPVLVELNAPLALEQSTYRGTGLGELAAQAERWMLTRADAVLTVSSPLRDYAVSLGIEPGRVHVVPNGVDPSLFRPGPPDPTVRARWGLGDGPILGFVGGLRPWHGVDALPIVLARLIDRYPTLRLLIAGDGPQRGELERDLRERGM